MLKMEKVAKTKIGRPVKDDTVQILTALLDKNLFRVKCANRAEALKLRARVNQIAFRANISFRSEIIGKTLEFEGMKSKRERA